MIDSLTVLSLILILAMTTGYGRQQSLRDYRITPGVLSPGRLNAINISLLFLAVTEATEEAILNSLFYADTMTGRNGNTIEALPVEKISSFLRSYGRKVR